MCVCSFHFAIQVPEALKAYAVIADFIKTGSIHEFRAIDGEIGTTVCFVAKTHARQANEENSDDLQMTKDACLFFS